ncbi:MAG: hypothetical protein JWO53_1120 [Chlamydiia bacterium]|nr:hypothetical protein [Chlamydiia bacterium]
MVAEQQKPQVLALGAVVKELEELVKLAIQCEKKDINPNISFDVVNKKLVELRKIVNDLHQSYINTLKKLSLTEDEVKKYQENIQKLNEPEKKLLLKIQELQKQSEEAKERMADSLKGKQETAKPAPKQKPAEKKKSSLIKPKQISRKTGWMKT